MIYHILNGDALAEKFVLKGEKIICRECLIDGDLRASNPEEFWEKRSKFIEDSFGSPDYLLKVKKEFDKLDKIKNRDEVNLWFGHDVFCQVNLWFILSLLCEKDLKLFRVFPDADGWDCCFNCHEGCLNSRKKISAKDIQRGSKLWKEFSCNRLESIDFTESEIFPHLKEVCQAILEKDKKITEILQKCKSDGITEFSEVFSNFRKQAPIYGFGDSQVKRIWETL